MRRFVLSFLVMIACAASVQTLRAEEGTFQKTGIIGKVAVNKDASGKVLSVTISNDQKSYTIAPIQTVNSSTGGDAYKITEADIMKIAKYDKKTVQVQLKCWNGKPIDIGPVSVITGESRNKLQ